MMTLEQWTRLAAWWDRHIAPWLQPDDDRTYTDWPATLYTWNHPGHDLHVDQALAHPGSIAFIRIAKPENVRMPVFAAYMDVALHEWFERVLVSTQDCWLFITVEDGNAPAPILQRRLDWLTGYAPPPDDWEDWTPLPSQAARDAAGLEDGAGWTAV